MRSSATAAGVVRQMPEFRARRTSTPTHIPSFDAQLASRTAALQAARPVRPAPAPLPVAKPTTFEAAAPPGVVVPLEPPADFEEPIADVAAVTTVRPDWPLPPARARILARAEALLGVPYVWGGDLTSGMDCSAYLSRAWGLSRQTTDTLSSFSDPIRKEQLAAGDALNLPTWKDPSRHGHVRIFDRWADDAKTRMWVYEETAETGMAVHRTIEWDSKYQPLRLRGLAA